MLVIIGFVFVFWSNFLVVFKFFFFCLIINNIKGFKLLFLVFWVDSFVFFIVLKGCLILLFIFMFKMVLYWVCDIFVIDCFVFFCKKYRFFNLGCLFKWFNEMGLIFFL